MRPRAWIPGTDSTVSVSSPFVVTERSHVGSPWVRNPYRFSASGAASVVTSGTLRSSPRRATRSKWSPCRWESRIRSSGGSPSGCSEGSVSRRDHSPLPR